MLRDESSEVDRLAVYFLNEWRAVTGLEPVDSLDFLTEFGQADWRNKARAALAAARGQEQRRIDDE